MATYSGPRPAGGLEELLSLMGRGSPGVPFSRGQGLLTMRPVPSRYAGSRPMSFGNRDALLRTMAARPASRFSGQSLRPGGAPSQFSMAFANARAAERAKAAELNAMLRGAGFGGFTFAPPGSSGGGNPSNTGTASGIGTSGPGGGGMQGNISGGPNTGGVAPAGMSAADAIAAGFSALAGTPDSDAPLSGGQIAAVTGAHPADVVGPNEGPLSTATLGTEGFGPLSSQVADAEAIDSSVATTGVLGGVQSIGITATGEQVTVDGNGVVSVGGQAVGVVGGGGGLGGDGGLGGLSGDTGGVGMDGSSNAGIGGPGGTGAVGGAGDAGQGTGGPGEGDMYGGHFTVGGDPKAGPDSMNVRFKASPGEHVVVVPQGMTPGQILSRPEQMSSWRMTGNRPNPGPGPTPAPPVPPGTPANSPGGIEAILRMMASGRR